MNPSTNVAAQVVVCVLVTDFLSGLVHWLEDTYGHPDWPIVGRLVTRPNILHHEDPRHFTRHSWWRSSWLLCALAVGLIDLTSAVGVGGWRVWLVAAIGANANQVHKWAHRTRRENGRLITLLQSTGLVQSRAHHAAHHRGERNTHYCVLTNLLNPVLDGVRFWLALEWLIAHTTGVRRRCEHARTERPHRPSQSFDEINP